MDEAPFGSEYCLCFNVSYFLYVEYFRYLESKLYAKYNKLCENLLVNIITQRNHLISFILNEVHNQQSHVHNDNGKLLLYLFNHVNIARYVPSMSDIDILTTWLLNLSITHKLNNLARFIISKFDYTVLYHELQVAIAVGIARAWLQHTPDVSTNVSITLLTDSMSYLIKPVNNEQIFNQWCWQIVFKLRLHLFDLTNPQLNNFHLYGLSNCHELLLLWIEIICAVYKQDELSCTYLLDNILQYCIYDEPLKCQVKDIFVKLIHTLPSKNSNTGKSISWIIFYSIVSMMNHSSVRYYGFLLQYCIYDEPLKCQVKDIFVKLIHTLPSKNTNTGISSLVSWVSSSSHILMNHTLLTKPLSHYANYEFFTLVNLEIEEYLLQIKTNLWPQLLVELNNNTGKTNIDASLKKVCSGLKLSPLTSSHLSLYRYLYYIVELPLSSSKLSALFVQKFFSLYLQRMNNVCVGHKFFEGITNNSLSKRLKAKLKEFQNYYETKVMVCFYCT
ncbi:uncharacterized protein LOC113469354 [Diaphorina citri]|uniref:Uncharacterized protein LOC113469354 n=1 Tax=Diaphorina citri TaxID=121845 RepID=A0A3Q0J2R8_DIACI|nr:uncharacterized protein LOC113469354 [Diaphorina citri]